MSNHSATVRRACLAGAVGLSLVLSACGGGGGGGSGGGGSGGGGSGGGGGGGGTIGDTTAPKVVVRSPDISATDAARQTTVSIQFDEAMDCSSLYTSTFSVKTQGTELEAAGEVACSGDTFTFTPKPRLLPSTAYVVLLSGAKDKAGNAMVGSESWQFTTKARNWGEAVALATDATATNRQVVLDSQGNPFAVWEQPADSSVWVSRGPVAQKLNSGVAHSPRIALAENGDGVVVWAESGTSVPNLWARRYVAATDTWEKAQQLSAFGAVTSADVAMDRAGNTVVVWSQFDDGTANIYSTWRTKDGSWGTSVLIENESGSCALPQLAVIGSRGLAVWEQKLTLDTTRIRSNTFTWSGGGSWDTVLGMVDETGGINQSVRLAMNGSSQATAVWEHVAPVTKATSIHSNHFDGGSWTGGREVAASGSEPRVALDYAGNAFVLWAAVTADGFQTLMEGVYTSGAGWGSPLELWKANLAGAHSVAPEIALNGQGGRIAVWQTGGVVVSAEYGKWGWGSHGIVRSTGDANAYQPRLALNDSGDAVVTWVEGGTTLFSRSYE